MTEEEFLTPLEISDEDSLYRQTHYTALKKSKVNANVRYPKESHFKPDDDGLSVHWDKFISVSGVYHVIGLSYRHGTTEYKNPRNYMLFKLPVAFVRSIPGIEKVNHSPIFNGNPAKLGYPNNYAHSSIIYSDDEEIRLKLSNYCQNNYAESFCEAEFNNLEEEVSKLREKLCDTPYHKFV